MGNSVVGRWGCVGGMVCFGVAFLWGGGGRLFGHAGVVSGGREGGGMGGGLRCRLRWTGREEGW